MIVYYLVNTVAASLIAATHERTIREDLSLGHLLKLARSCVAGPHPRGMSFSRTLDMLMIDFMERSQRKLFLEHPVCE